MVSGRRSNGLTEWDGTWFRHVRPGLLNYHHHTPWLTHQLALYGVGHGNHVDAHGSENFGLKQVNGKVQHTHETWNYIAKFIDDAMTLRVPADADPKQGYFCFAEGQS